VSDTLGAVSGDNAWGWVGVQVQMMMRLQLLGGFSLERFSSDLVSIFSGRPAKEHRSWQN
jgi:hypothetical protein